ncbi:hypothetical protein PRIPAC_73166 [Pristionchus pacificus]|uniref:Uncharacterized protein n=1 Tax=Pristionchus pacificus TaxID=54126 RepID=A0A2A6C655_PRIPA|nr:hypothetical protein PRIPAC_73166 [Pristionchus pacificus]|eukprot:PDM73596.1 hypothetical protein PRIPAC_40952 [Pristionchus pacificus]
MPPPHHANHTNGHVRSARSERQTEATELFEKPPSIKCCCGKIHLQKGAGIIGGLSLVSVLLNALLVLLGVGRLGLNPYFEVLILIFDFFSVVCLLRGLHKRKSGLLRPFLFFNFLWNAGLILLFIWCMIRMARGTDLSKPIMNQLGRSRPSPHHANPFLNLGRPPEESGTHWLGFLLLGALAVLICVGCSFIHVIYRMFRVFAYDEEKEANRLTPPI